MKEKILRVGKIALPILTLFLYCSTFIEFSGSMPPSTVSVWNMLLSVLFLLSYTFTLWVYRKNETVLWFSISVWVLFGILTLIQFFFSFSLPNFKLPTLIYDLVVTPFHGLMFFAHDIGELLLFCIIPVILLITYQIVLLILLKSNILKKKEENQ